MTHWTESLFVENAGLYMPELQTVESQSAHEVDELLSLLDTDPSSVLDVGCGLGRHTRAFAERGLQATGIDISGPFLSQARKRASADGVADRTEFRKRDMRTLDEVDEQFDLVVCLFNTFGYFSEAENRKVLEQMRDRLTEGGACVVQVGNKDALLTDLPESRIHESEDGMIVEQYEFDSPTSRLTRTRDTFEADDGALQHLGRTEYKVRNYSPGEIEQRLRRAGFETVTLYGGFDDVPPELSEDRIVAIAR